MKNSIKYVGIILFVLVSFFSVNKVNAITLYSQLIKTSYYDAGPSQKNFVFTGVSGTLRKVTLSAASSYSGQTLGVAIYKCLSGGLSCTNTGMAETYSPNVTLTNTQTDYTFTLNSPVDLISDQFYVAVPQRGIYPQNLRIYGSASNVDNNTVCGSPISGGNCSIADTYFILSDEGGPTLPPPPPPENGLTQMISFSPANGTTTSTTVNFTYSAYIAEDDISFWQGWRMTFYVQGQPVGESIYFLDNISATTTGYFNYSTTTSMATGNYIVNACLQRYYLGNIIGGFDIFAGGCEYHQFVVQTPTFLGTLFQSGMNSIDNQINNLTSTSSAVILGNYCNLFSGFDILQCVYALLIPTSSQIKDTMDNFYNDFLTRAPWGYGSLVISRLLGYGNIATSSLTSSNLTITLPNSGVFATATSTSLLKGKTITFIDWNSFASSTVHNYWSPALTPLNNFLNIMMGGAFIFWLYHFFKKIRP